MLDKSDQRILSDDSDSSNIKIWKSSEKLSWPNTLRVIHQIWSLREPQILPN